MVKREYIPSRGDIVWMPFDPTVGHEQKGDRPALVISSRDFNRATGLAYVFPITMTKKGYAWHIPFSGKEINGFIMIEHLRSIDWRKRKVIFRETADLNVIVNVSNAMQAVVS